MIEFLNFILPFVYVFLVLGSVIFGISLAVNLWVHNTVSKIRKEADKNFTSSLTYSEMKDVFFAIETAKKGYCNYIEESKKIKKNKSKKIEFNSENTPALSSVFLALIKDVYKPFSISNGKERGYLSFTKNEIFSVLRTLLKRLDEILSKSGVSWLKNVKISILASGISVYVSYKNFAEKIWVAFIFKAVNFFMWFLRIFSPVSLTKYLVKNFTSQNLSLLIYDTIVEVVGKELAVVYKNERKQETKENIVVKRVV